MQNKTGRYYIGMGNKNCENFDGNDTTTTTTTFSYMNVTTQEIPYGTCFKRELPLKYSVKAITKAAYFLDEKDERFVNTGIIVNLKVL
uniref:Uncharacterized protein n=1 Tax=Panagrolaimus superbus TaxID=310955 RepID=A0A914Y1C2_9BILA